MHFKRLSFKEWQQFQDIDITFHERLTILTGANGSGKTTIINNILARHCGWNTTQSATPALDAITGFVRYFTRYFNGSNHTDNKIIGTLTYSDDDVCDLQVKDADVAEYSLNLERQKNVECLFIPSHRPVYRYRALENIPVKKKEKGTAFTEVANIYRDRYYANNNEVPSFYIKNTLIGWAIQGSGNEFIQADAAQVEYFKGFEEILKKVLPQSLGFQKLEIRKMEIVFVCNDKRDEFVLEQASGGISALIDIAWQLYMFSPKQAGEKGFTVMIDEVENHLHPTMQRRILPDLLAAFPDVHFIVSTHSPLVVGSAKDSSVFVLRYKEDRKIYSEKIDLVNEARSANEILDEVLGVSFSMPIWAETALEDIVSKYSKEKVTKEGLAQMRQELNQQGLGKLMPEATLSITS